MDEIGRYWCRCRPGYTGEREGGERGNEGEREVREWEGEEWKEGGREWEGERNGKREGEGRGEGVRVREGDGRGRMLSVANMSLTGSM